MKIYCMKNKFYEKELRAQFGLEKGESVKGLIQYLRNYYDWFYDGGKANYDFGKDAKKTDLIQDLLMNNVYSQFLYNRNLVNDPIMEQIHEIKRVEDQKKRRKKELELLEQLYPDDQKINIVDHYIDQLKLAADVENQKHRERKEGIPVSQEEYNIQKYLNKDRKNYFK